MRGDAWAFGGEKALDGDPNTYWTTNEGVTRASLEVDLEGPEEIDTVEIQEAAGLGQRVQEYKVEGQVDSDWKLLAQGTTIGDRQLHRFAPVTVWKVWLTILKASASPAIRKFGLYLDTAPSPAAAEPAKTPAGQAKSEWVYAGSDGKLKYKTTAAGDRIMDYSHAGYMGGGVTLPEVPVKITVQPMEGDSTATIQEAIDKVSALNLENESRGAVLLAPGDYTCSTAISIRTSGVVLRGSGSGANGSTIKMVGGRHVALAVGGGRTGRAAGRESKAVQTFLADPYVPAGAVTFTVADATGLGVGDTIEIRRPVTPAWVHFMQMDDLTRDGRPQTWIRTGTSTITTRTIAALSGNKITLDVPLSDSCDAQYLNPPGTAVVKVSPPTLLSQIGIEHLCIQAPPMEVSYTQHPYTAVRLTGQDCWMRNVRIEETMNSVSLGGRRITLERVAIHRTVPNVGASKPAEFAPNAGQVLLDRCSSEGDNIWHVATGAGVVGPIVLLNCTFRGNGHIEGHQRWTTGMLLDNCQIPGGGIDFKNRGAMGSGHGWGVGWAVAWNCIAKTFVVQQPPGACNWMIGCTGMDVPTPRPFDSAPTLPLGISDSPAAPVVPQSLYLAQLAERLGPQAIKNIGYSIADSGEEALPSSIRNPKCRRCSWSRCHRPGSWRGRRTS